MVIISNMKKLKYKFYISYVNKFINMTSVMTLFEQILHNPLGFDNWTWLSRHHELTIQHVLNFPLIPWDMNIVSTHPNITMEDINNNPTLNWNYKYISYNRNLTNEMLISHCNEKWDIIKLLSLSFLSVDTIMAVPQLKKFAKIDTAKDLEFDSFENKLSTLGFFD